MRIYTRSGDKGETSLIYGKRVPKNHVRVEAYGTCDEANTIIGQAVSSLERENFSDKQCLMNELLQIQTILFHAGAELATPPDQEVTWQLTQNHIEQLEEQIDHWQSYLPELRQFILPGGHMAASILQHARAVTRRAERLAVGLQGELKESLVLTYLNRLSDYLFVAARLVNHQLQVEEITLKIDR